MAKQKLAKQKVTFAYAAPEAQTVSLAGDFTGWQQAPLTLKKDKSGVWKKTVSLPPGRYQYRLLVDGQWRDDPQEGANQFKIYRAAAVGGAYALIDSTAAQTYTDLGVIPTALTRYYYVTFETSTLSTFRLPSEPRPRE